MNTNVSSHPIPLVGLLLTVDRAYIILNAVFSGFSFAGALVIITCYAVYPGIRTTSRKLLAFISVVTLFKFVSTWFEAAMHYRTLTFPNEKSFICQTAAALYVYSEVAIALSTIAITFYLFLCVTARCITVANRIVVFLQFFCCTMPFIVTVSADLSGVFGYDSSDIIKYGHPTQCWLSGRVSNPLPWYLITVEGWVLTAYVICSLLYFPILFSTIRNQSTGKQILGDHVIEDLGIATANEQLRFIPVIYICTRIWGTMYFLFTRYPDDRHLRGYDWLLIIKAIGDNSQGLANAMFFCLATKQIRRLISRQLARCCFCFCGWCQEHRIIGNKRWMKVPQIVVRASKLGNQRRRTLDGSDLDISGISLDLPEETDVTVHEDEDEVLFEQ